MIHKLKIKRSPITTLRTLYGLGFITAKKITGLLGLHPLAKSRSLFIDKELLSETLTSLTIDYKLRAIVFSRIFILLRHATYRGYRHALQLPTRGQRTHANGKTQSRLVTAAKWLPISSPKYASRSILDFKRDALKKKGSKGKEKGSKPKEKVTKNPKTKK